MKLSLWLGLSLLTASVVGAVSQSSAVASVPRPRLSAIDAIGIAQKQASKSTTGAVPVEILWSKASEFRSRVAGDGFLFDGDDPDGYSWFVTFVFRDPRITVRVVGEFTSTDVVRVKDDGTLGVLIRAGN